MKTLSEVATRVWKVLAASFTVRVCMVGWFLTVQPSYGQIVNANLFGTVTDPTAAVIPGVKMTLTSVDRGFILNSESDSEGTYSFFGGPTWGPPFGAVKEGFKATSISGIRLLVNQQARVDVPLELGEATTTVDVVGGTPMVESATASLGAVIRVPETTQLPLNLRRYGALALLVPGTTPDNGGSAGGDFSSPFSETTYSANGARTSSNNYLIDGVVHL